MFLYEFCLTRSSEFVPEKKMIHVICCRGVMAEAIPFEMRMFQWEHFGVSVNLVSKVLLVRHNNKVSCEADFPSDY